MIQYIPMGMPVSNLKRKYEIQTIIQPAASSSIKNAINHNLPEAFEALDKGLARNPQSMLETLTEDIVQLPKQKKELFFGNFSDFLKNEQLANFMKPIQDTLKGVKGISRPSLESSIKILVDMFKENGVNLNTLAKK